MKELSPICLFVYNRISQVQCTCEALQRNYLASESELFIFSDAAKNMADQEKVNEVRQFIHSVNGFKSIQIVENNHHRGLANSLISGITEIINHYGKVIVLEDDLITSPNFLDFINQGLDFYANDKRIFNISGYSMNLPSLKSVQKDYYLGFRASSWGWGTWRDRWNVIDWAVSDYNQFKYNIKQNIRFLRGGSDMPRMLRNQRKGIIDSWAIRWCYHQFKSEQLTVIASKSKVQNIGIGENATNTKRSRRFVTKLDNGENRNFLFDPNPDINFLLIKEFKRMHSIWKRSLDHLHFRVFRKRQFNDFIIKNQSSTDKKKLVVFHPALAPYRIDFFNYLAKKFDVKFYFFFDNVKEQQFNQIELRKKIDFEFNLLTFGFECNNRPFRFGVYKRLIQQKPAICLCSEYSSVTVSVVVFKLLFKPSLKVYTISDDSIDLSIKRKKIRKLARKLLSYLVDGVIFPSKKVCEWYSNNVNNKTRTFELPIIHSNTQFRDKLVKVLPQSEQYLKEYNLTGKKIYLYVGRLVKIKNIDFLIRSFAQISRENEVLIIVGSGEECFNLKHLAKELKLEDSLIFTGKLEGDNLISWYNIAQCFILPSYVDPYGAVVNEALLAGCKVLCSNLAGASELINDNCGYLFNPNDELQLKQLIENIAKDIVPIISPIKLKKDLMPFTFEEKSETLFEQLTS